MKAFFWLGLISLLLLSACGEKAPELKKGQATPAFKTASLKDSVIAFPEQYSGKVVVIRFWADWCPFCESEMRAIQPIYEKYREQGIEVLAINVRQDQQTAADFVKDMALSYPILLDFEGDIARSYGVLGLPTTYVLNRHGTLHTRIIGESSAALFERVVKEAM